METLWQDARYAFRALLKNPAFSVVAIVALALGIGANTAIFSVVNAVLLRPLPYHDPDRLVLVKESLPELGWSLLSASPAEFLDYKQGNDVFSEIAAFTDISLNLTGQGEPRRIQAARVSASLFPLLGARPAAGRAFLEEEDEAGKGGVVVLSHRIWQGQFGADPAIIGKGVKLDDKPYTVVGVMPPEFHFPYAWTSLADAAELWIPLALTEEEKKNRAGSFDYGVIGRLRPGVSLAGAEANIKAVAARAQEQHPEVYNGNVHVTVTVVGLRQDVVKGSRALLLILLGAVGLVLFISCANVANLQIARSTTRQKEIAIRSAVGATTARLVRQLLTESVMLALAGGGCGLLLAAWAVDLIARFGPRDVPRLHEVSLDSTVLGFTLAVSLLTGVLFGLAPALQSSRLDINETLKEAGGRAGRGREGKRLRGSLVIFETALALVLLVGAGLLINSFARLIRVPPGFDPEGVVIARTTMPGARYPKRQQSKALYRQVTERLAALPGVESAAVASNLPLTGQWQIGFIIDGRPGNEYYEADGALVSNDYFRAMGIRLIRGRPFTDDDREDAPPVVVINETMARSFWPGEDPIGQRVKWGGWGKDAWLTVVGVAADIKFSSLEAAPAPAIYMPIFQIPRARPGVVFIARASAGAEGLIPAVRGEIRAADEELPVYDLRTMKQVVAESVSQRRFSMTLLAAFAAAALLLAAIGLYAVISFSVTERTHEIGIRMALGASRGQVLKLVMGEGLSLILTGTLAGIAGALALTRLMSSLLYGVSATDFVTFAATSLVLAGVALGACFVPARRATKVDPMVALRHE
jgi:predicted permease